jgi:hypothetical protein
MRVKLCGRCPYTPRDLDDHYDPDATLYVCAKCDNERHLREANWRRTCPNEISTRTTPPSVAPFAPEGLASFATTLLEPRFVQKSASTSSTAGGKPTAIGCGDFARPDDLVRNDHGLVLRLRCRR